MRATNFLIGISLLASPVCAGTVETMMGARLATPTTKAVSSKKDMSVPPQSLNVQWKSLRKASDILKGLKPDSPSTTRSLLDQRIYKQASPSVVLITNDEGSGSGAVINSTGLIITNYHVVGDGNNVSVAFKPTVEGAAISNRKIYQGTVIKRDQIADLALVKVDMLPVGTPVLKLGTINNAAVGQDVFAIGHPLGEEWSYTRGVISQIRRDYSWEYEENVFHKADVIQTQTPINPGNSGGPLLDESLHILGLNTFDIGAENMNYAVSSDDIIKFLDRAGDRFLVSPAPKSKPAVATDCQFNVLGEEHVSDPENGLLTSIDSSCSGKADLAVFTPDDTGKPAIWFISDPDTGKITIIGFDPTRDGNITYALIDSEGIGKPNLIAYYNKGEFPTWSRIEPYTS